MTFKLARHCAAAAVCLLGAGVAMAQTSPWYLGVAQSLGHESNVYRLGDNQVLPLGLSKSDNVSGTSLVGGIDQALGRQRLTGSANLRANRYANNKSLNNDSYGLNLALDWATVGRLSGTLSVASDQNLAQFNNRGVLETRKNEARSQQVDFRARLGVVTRYTLEAAVGWRGRSFSAPEYDRSEYRQTSGSLGLNYRPSAGLLLGAALRLTEARYPRFRQLTATTYESDRLSRQDIDLTAHWQPSGNSSIKLRLSPTRSSYDKASVEDFSGLTGSAGWAWQLSGKTRLNTTVSRDTGQSADAVNLGIFGPGIVDDSRHTTALSLQATHELSGKLSLNAGVLHARRSLRNSVLAADGTPLALRTGRDRSNTLSLGARWLPTRSTQVGCSLQADTRSSSNQALSVSFSGNSVSCFGQLVLQ